MVSLTNGLALGLLTFAGWATVFHKLPPKIKQWASDHSLLVDFFFTFATYIILSGTIVALFAAAIVGLGFEGYMHIIRNKEDFTWFYDILETIKIRLKQLKEWLIERNFEYKQRKIINE